MVSIHKCNLLYAHITFSVLILNITRVMAAFRASVVLWGHWLVSSSMPKMWQFMGLRSDVLGSHMFAVIWLYGFAVFQSWVTRALWVLLKQKRHSIAYKGLSRGLMQYLNVSVSIQAKKEVEWHDMSFNFCRTRETGNLVSITWRISNGTFYFCGWLSPKKKTCHILWETVHLVEEGVGVGERER